METLRREDTSTLPCSLAPQYQDRDREEVPIPKDNEWNDRVV